MSNYTKYKFYWTDYVVAADDGSFGQFEKTIEELMIGDGTAENPEYVWNEITYNQNAPFDIDWSVRAGKITLPYNNKWFTLKVILIDTSENFNETVTYWTQQELDWLGDTYKALGYVEYTYALLENESWMKAIKARLIEENPTVFFNKLHKNRWINTTNTPVDTYKSPMRINLIEQWWLRNTLPMDIKLESNAVEEIDIDTFNTYHFNKIGDYGYFLPIASEAKNVLEEFKEESTFTMILPAPIFIVWVAGIHYDFDYVPVNNCEMQYVSITDDPSGFYEGRMYMSEGISVKINRCKDFWYNDATFSYDEHQTDCFLNYTLASNDATLNNATGFDMWDPTYFLYYPWSADESGNKGCWKIVTKLSDNFKHKSQKSYSDGSWNANNKYEIQDFAFNYINPAEASADNESGIFRVKVKINNQDDRNWNYGAIVYIRNGGNTDDYPGSADGNHYPMIDVSWDGHGDNYNIPEVNWLATFFPTQDHQRFDSGWYLLIRNDGASVFDRRYAEDTISVYSDMNVEFDQTGMGLLPVKDLSSMDDLIRVKCDILNQSYLNKHRFIIAQDTALNQDTTVPAWTEENNIGPAQATFLVLPIVPNLSYETYSETDKTWTMKSLSQKDAWEALFNPINDSSNPKEAPQLILNNGNIVNALETTIPMTWLFQYDKWYFNNYIKIKGADGDQDKLIPCFAFAVPAVDWTQKVHKISFFEYDSFITFDFSTWTWENEPIRLSPQFLLMTMDFTANNHFRVPLELFNYDEDQNNWNFDFDISWTNSPNFIMDQSFINDHFATSMARDNFIFNIDQAFSFQTTAWNNWIQQNYLTENVSRQNLKDQIQMQNMQYDSSVINTTLGSTNAMIGAVSQGAQQGAEAGPIGAAVGAVVGGAKGGLNVWNTWRQMYLQRNLLDMQQAIANRNIDATYRQVRLSPSTPRLSPYQANNVLAKPGYSFNIVTPWDNQIQTALTYLYYNGYLYGAMEPLKVYNNRRLYNIMDIDISKTYNDLYERVRKIMYGDAKFKFWRHLDNVAAFLTWFGTPHGWYKTNYFIETENFVNNIENDWLGLTIDGNFSDWEVLTNDCGQLYNAQADTTAQYIVFDELFAINNSKQTKLLYKYETNDKVTQIIFSSDFNVLNDNTSRDNLFYNLNFSNDDTALYLYKKAIQQGGSLAYKDGDSTDYALAQYIEGEWIWSEDYTWTDGTVWNKDSFTLTFPSDYTVTSNSIEAKYYKGNSIGYLLNNFDHSLNFTDNSTLHIGTISIELYNLQQGNIITSIKFNDDFDIVGFSSSGEGTYHNVFFDDGSFIRIGKDYSNNINLYYIKDESDSESIPIYQNGSFQPSVSFDDLGKWDIEKKTLTFISNKTVTSNDIVNSDYTGNVSCYETEIIYGVFFNTPTSSYQIWDTNQKAFQPSFTADDGTVWDFDSRSLTFINGGKPIQDSSIVKIDYSGRVIVWYGTLEQVYERKYTLVFDSIDPQDIPSSEIKISSNSLLFDDIELIVNDDNKGYIVRWIPETDSIEYGNWQNFNVSVIVDDPKRFITLSRNMRVKVDGGMDINLFIKNTDIENVDGKDKQSIFDKIKYLNQDNWPDKFTSDLCKIINLDWGDNNCSAKGTIVAVDPQGRFSGSVDLTNIDDRLHISFVNDPSDTNNDTRNYKFTNYPGDTDNTDANIYPYFYKWHIYKNSDGNPVLAQFDSSKFPGGNCNLQTNSDGSIWFNLQTQTWGANDVGEESYWFTHISYITRQYRGINAQMDILSVDLTTIINIPSSEVLDATVNSLSIQLIPVLWVSYFTSHAGKGTYTQDDKNELNNNSQLLRNNPTFTVNSHNQTDSLDWERYYSLVNESGGYVQSGYMVPKRQADNGAAGQFSISWTNIRDYNKPQIVSPASNVYRNVWCVTYQTIKFYLPGSAAKLDSGTANYDWGFLWIKVNVDDWSKGEPMSIGNDQADYQDYQDDFLQWYDEIEDHYDTGFWAVPSPSAIWNAPGNKWCTVWAKDGFFCLYNNVSGNQTQVVKLTLYDRNGKTVDIGSFTVVYTAI